MKMLWSISILLLSIIGSCYGRRLQNEYFSQLELEKSGNSSSRFQNIPVKNDQSKLNNKLIMFIAITSGPFHSSLRHAIRNTWILPCKASPFCDYRFFVDTTHQQMNFTSPNAERLRKEITVENDTHADLVIRDECPMILKRHPWYINYGNSPPIRENMNRKDDYDSTSPTYGKNVPIPDYPLRRLYKIDWKVCFMKWISSHYHQSSLPLYHIYVEDDSFVCTENLLHQFVYLHNTTSNSSSQYAMRTGTPMFDGYDDSSTILTANIAHLFAQYYPSPELNCSMIEKEQDLTNLVNKHQYFAWGNSWMRANCNWPQLFYNPPYNLSITKANLACSKAKMTRHGAVEFPCFPRPLILHHHSAPAIFLQEEKSKAKQYHLCEYMLLIDKVKDPEAMKSLWSVSKGHRYHDLSALFLYPEQEAGKGYSITLKKLDEEEKACELRLQSSSNNISSNSNNSSSSTNSNSSGSVASSRSGKEYPCLFEKSDYYPGNSHIRRQLMAAIQGAQQRREVDKLLYPSQIDEGGQVEEQREEVEEKQEEEEYLISYRDYYDIDGRPFEESITSLGQKRREKK